MLFCPGSEIPRLYAFLVVVSAALSSCDHHPVEETCTRCHKEEGNKNFKPFKWEERKDTSHPVAPEAKE